MLRGLPANSGFGPPISNGRLSAIVVTDRIAVTASQTFTAHAGGGVVNPPACGIANLAPLQLISVAHASLLDYLAQPHHFGFHDAR